MIIGGREFDTACKCHIMGILNVTPDSFYDGGKWKTIDKAMRHAEDMVQSGADIIDVGGESTRPGFAGVSEQEEIDRTAPVIEALSSRISVPLSIDTSKSAVAKAAISAGAVMVNDIWGLKNDPELATVIARAGVTCCLMHNRDNMDYNDFLSDLLSDLRESTSLAMGAGVGAEKIILDPGIGFAKSLEMNLEVINKIDKVRELGFPVLLGVSRKSFIGQALGLPVEQRLNASLAAAVVGVLRECSFLRVHDVTETRHAVSMAEAILRGRV